MIQNMTKFENVSMTWSTIPGPVVCHSKARLQYIIFAR
jgi:hypothetical protein